MVIAPNVLGQRLYPGSELKSLYGSKHIASLRTFGSSGIRLQSGILLANPAFGLLSLILPSFIPAVGAFKGVIPFQNASSNGCYDCSDASQSYSVYDGSDAWQSLRPVL